MIIKLALRCGCIEGSASIRVERFNWAIIDSSLCEWSQSFELLMAIMDICVNRYVAKWVNVRDRLLLRFNPFLYSRIDRPPIESLLNFRSKSSPIHRKCTLALSRHSSIKLSSIFTGSNGGGETTPYGVVVGGRVGVPSTTTTQGGGLCVYW